MSINFLTKIQKNALKGSIIIPADKSISHRSLIIGVLTRGKIKIENYSSSADCLATLNIIKALGAEIDFKDKKTLILNGGQCFKMPSLPLDCGNSGTSMRLLSGVLAAQHFNSELIGDISLSKRPMRRIIEPLSLMGAKIVSNEDRAPLKIYSSKLQGIDYASKIASAQVKSCILLAGLEAKVQVSLVEPYLSRNHTELMLKYFGANIEYINNKTILKPSELVPKNLKIAGDISSAAFFMTAATVVPNSDITIRNVGINETRSGIIDVLKQMGADIEITNKMLSSMEPVADVRVKYCKELKGIEIGGAIIPRLIDEIPIIAILATQAEGKTVIKDAGDLRNKESDRIKAVVAELTKVGANIKETKDGFVIEGKTQLNGSCDIETYHDHRLAMSLYVASLISEKQFIIKDFQWVNTSFPEFLNIMAQIGAEI